MVISTVNQVVYNGDGITTAWPYTFRIIDRTDIKLTIIDADGTETDVTADYYVDTVNNTVYYPGYSPGAEPPQEEQPPKLQTGQRLVVYRELPITQEKDLGEKWPFYVIELALDKLTMILQQVFDWWGRTLKVSQGKDITGDVDLTVPMVPDTVITVNADGTGFVAREALMEVNGAWDGEGRQIKGVADPTDNQDAATMKYVNDYADGSFMKLKPDGTAWDSRNLPISNVTGPNSVKDAANKDYVDRILAGYAGQGDRFVFFDNVAQMQAAELVPSQVAVTLGYHDVNDGGAGVYTIRDIGADTPDGGSLIEIAGTSYAAELINDGVIDVRQFGVVADGVTDDTAPLQAALDFGKAKKIKIVGLNLEIHTTKTIFIDYDCDFTDTVLFVDSSTLTNDRGYSISPAVAVGMNTNANGMNSTIPSVTNTNVAVGTFDVGIGVFVGSCYDCNLKLQSYRYFEVGIWMAGYTRGCAYNSIFVDQAIGCKIGLKMYGYDSNSYVTENNIFGGRYYQTKTVSDVTDSRHISVCSSNNVLYKPCVEGSYDNVEYPIEFTGSSNLIIAPRLEGMTKVYHKLGAVHNIIIAPFEGYNITNVYDPNITDINGIGNAVLSSGSLDLIGTLSSCIAVQTNYINTPGIVGYAAGTMNSNNISGSNTNWCYRLYANRYELKQSSDSYARLALNVYYGARIYFGDGSAEHDAELRYASSKLHVYNVPFVPWGDNILDLGLASNRWKEIFAGTGTINTSDEREKQDIEPIEDAVFRAWAKVNFVQYRFRDAVAKKGDNARIHVGLIAQRVKEAFESEGLDAFEYGLLCYNEWDDEYEDVEVVDVEEVRDENGEVITPQQSHKEKRLVNAAGNRYGIRYDEALALECAYQRWLNNKLEARVAALEEIVRI